ncbi:KIR protein [Plasmodium knowlesi strain H]|uniref:KIR protein n=2 Tax=Plasmodium knowlesi TaxID=5850 RepID=A0A679KZN6_PLAKH|nr:KIR protein [Plasmodium knowlesi strain H]OTN66078.1 KIR protein [Plasmodium knowlesi]CAA9987687.1 KIR protein [Plasmodium knowlesi strain H]VVS77161.1 KIR protein [Plasmodium knowlesi strain H]
MASDADKLPSDKIYEEFDRRTCSNGGAVEEAQVCDGELKKTVSGVLGILNIRDDTFTNKIVGNCMHVCTKISDVESYYDPCKFLYFWIGTQLWQRSEVKGNTANFQTIMNTIFSRTDNRQFWTKCNSSFSNLYDGISKERFQEAKELYDYYYDYNELTNLDNAECTKYCQNGRCTNAFNTANSTYQQLTSRCEPHSFDAYCTEFKIRSARKGEREFAQPQQIQCKAKKVEEAPLEEVTDPPDLMNDMLAQLPSSLLYEEFEKKERLNKCNSSTIQSLMPQLQPEMKDYNCKNDCIEKALYAWCFINNETEAKDKAWYDDRFHLFYSWLGQKMFGHSNSKDKISYPMNQVYNVLKGLHIGQDCKDMWEDVLLDSETPGENFSNRKALYEYFVDYGTLESHLGISGIGTTAKKKCEKKYYEHINKITKACNAISDYCKKEGGHENDEYCTWFNGKKENYCNKDKIAKLTCKQVVYKPPSSGPGSTGTWNPGSSGTASTGDHSISGSDGSSGGVGGMVGGTLATVGLPTIGFFLYKYTNIFDGIKKSLFGGSNNTGGRNRGRRSTIGRQHFEDILTENDSSTLGDDGSTTLGGGGGGSSTLGGSSTDVSTIYNEPPRRTTGRRERAGTNNRRPGNIRYYAT